jgi:hypothetical protein
MRQARASSCRVLAHLRCQLHIGNVQITSNQSRVNLVEQENLVLSDAPIRSATETKYDAPSRVRLVLFDTAGFSTQARP